MIRRFLLATLMATSVSACAAQETETSPSSLTLTEAVFVGQPLRLINEQGQCTLVTPDQTRMTLDMQWPCQFSLDRARQLRVEMFREVPIFVVEHSERLPAPSRDCLTTLQAVRQIKDTLEASEASRIASCGPGQWDQKMYVAFFTW